VRPQETSDERDALPGFLGRGEAYGQPGKPVELVTTHAAWIFLVDERAFKMKRPVRYSFLDFSTVERRHAALEAELALNRRTAPMLYRRLVPVTRSDAGELSLGGAGEPVEWLLEMRRFDQGALLDRLAERGALDASTIERLAEAIAALHDAAEVRTDRGGHAAMREVIDGNAGDLGGLADGVFERVAIEDLNRHTRAELERRRELLEQRRAGGMVRHCHGDLHLSNIVEWEQRPVLFDCLEFDENLAIIDTFYDLAFLLMDLCHRQLRPLAQRLLSSYLDLSWDDAGVALLPLFLSCRAAIRAKVEGLTADLEQDPAERKDLIGAARAYLDLAAGFLRPEAPRLIAIGGVSGTGKTTLARRLAPAIGAAPGAVLLRSDVTRKRLCGVAPTVRLGPEAYDERVSRRVYETLVGRATTLLAAGHAVIVDAVMLDPADRARVEQVARDQGVRFDGLWLCAPAGTLAARVATRREDASDATTEVVEAQLEVDPGAVSWAVVESTGKPGEVEVAASGALGLSPRS
jgi:aminoglycoside phosphotransferase family enzyme/predicted kinase